MMSLSGKRSLENEDDENPVPKRIHEVADGEEGMRMGSEEFKNIIFSINASQEKDVALHFLNQFQELAANITNFSDLEEILRTIFEETNGILRFLRSRKCQTPFDEPKERAFSILKELLINKSIDTALVLPHCLKLKDTIDCIWKSTRESARLQTASLQCLISLLENYGSLTSAFDCDASDLYRNLLLSSERTSSFQPSVRGEMIILLGLIAYKFKNDVFRRNTQDQLLNYLLKAIKAQTGATDRHIEAAILLGAIRGLDYFLRAYSSDYVDKLVNFEETLAAIINPEISIAPSSEATIKIKRREFQRATLTLVEHHGSLFKDQLYRKHRQWFKDLLTWCRSKNQDDSSRAKTAMISFLRVVCDCLVDATEVNDQAARFRHYCLIYLTEELVQIFQNTEPGNTDSDISIEGIRLIKTLELPRALEEELSPELHAKLQECIAELEKAELGPGHVEELSTEDAEALVPDLSGDDIVYFESILSDVPPQKLSGVVSRLIQAVNENEHTLRMQGSNLVAGVISIWDKIKINFESELIHRTLCDLVALDEEAVGNSEELSNWWIWMMSSKRKSVHEKGLFPDFLPFFGLSANLIVRNQIWSYIATMNDSILEQDKGSFLIMTLFDGAMCICEAYPDNLDLVIAVSSSFRTLAVSIHENHVELEDECWPGCHHYSSLVKAQNVFEAFVRQVAAAESSESESIGLRLVEHVYKMTEFGHPGAAALLHKFCLRPCLANLHKKHIEIFAETNIYSIVTAATNQPYMDDDWISKTTAISLYETIVFLTDGAYSKNKLNNIYTEHLPTPPGKPGELFRVMTNIWASIRTNPIRTTDTNKRTRKIQYDYNSAAFNATATTIIATKPSNTNNFVRMLLDDFEGNRTWEKIIDCTSQLYFPIVKEAETSGSGSSKSDIDTKKRVNQGVCDRELNPLSSRRQRLSSRLRRTNNNTTDAGRFDFTNVSNRSYSSEHGYNAAAPPTEACSYDILVNHPCLDTLIRVVNYAESVTKDATSMPIWMVAILKKFTSTNIPVNVKLFMCALVLNCQNIFKPYGSEFIESIIEAIVAGNISNRPSENSSSLNSFERELIAMLLNWNIAPSKDPAEKLVVYCLLKVLYKRNDIQQENLKLLTDITSSWIKTKFRDESYEAILATLEMEDKTLGLQGIIALMKAEVLPCDELGLRNFIGRVGQLLSSSTLQVYQLAAEALGMLLRLCGKFGLAHFSQTVSHVRRFFTAEKGRTQSFMIMMNAVALNYPRILVSYKSDVEAILEHKAEVAKEASALLKLIHIEEQAASQSQLLEQGEV